MTNPARPGWGDAWTVDDLQGLPEDDQVYEIFDGSLLVSPHADVFHGAVANRLRRILDRQAPAGVLVGQDIGVSAKRSSYFVPDLFVAGESALDSGGAPSSRSPSPCRWPTSSDPRGLIQSGC
ncbi:Uma2 family endonuclease [Micromonospora arida]|uniref:Uma2 family endonuclease n=1 Tax=Micromonospora arida TaxID=2203715 RepID=UPI001315338F|nr:Uma2 family endonuclease [Micromonospora arida]